MPGIESGAVVHDVSRDVHGTVYEWRHDKRQHDVSGAKREHLPLWTKCIPDGSEPLRAQWQQHLFFGLDELHAALRGRSDADGGESLFL